MFESYFSTRAATRSYEGSPVITETRIVALLVVNVTKKRFGTKLTCSEMF